ncbi:MAG TPA: glycosyltransferase [Puia sp.]|nr:glycosyltransferase [Puia sp.]
MIFVTIGIQEPFDRLIKAMDEIAPELEGIPIIAQVYSLSYKAVNLKTFEFVSQAEFEDYFSRATLIVAHAGMGTIISALVKDKPIIVMPRLTKYKEHRSDHQIATANACKELNYVHVAEDENELKTKVVEIIRGQSKGSLYKIGPYASPGLIQAVKEGIGL